LDEQKSNRFDDPATLLAQENVRIPVTGLEYPEEVLVAPLGRGRSTQYEGDYLSGKAKAYHVDVLKGPSARRLQSVRWFAPILKRDGARVVLGVYPIKGCGEIRRCDMELELSGAPSNDERMVHKIDLGSWMSLDRPIVIPDWMGGSWFRYTTKDRIESAAHFRDLSETK